MKNIVRTTDFKYGDWVFPKERPTAGTYYFISRDHIRVLRSKNKKDRKIMDSISGKADKLTPTTNKNGKVVKRG